MCDEGFKLTPEQQEVVYNIDPDWQAFDVEGVVRADPVWFIGQLIAHIKELDRDIDRYDHMFDAIHDVLRGG